MSVIKSSGDRLIQRVGQHEEELGRIEHDSSSETYVLWVHDFFGVLGRRGGWIRADEYSTMNAAKDKSCDSQVLVIVHANWTRLVSTSETDKNMKCHGKEIDSTTVRTMNREHYKDCIRRTVVRWSIEISRYILTIICDVSKRLFTKIVTDRFTWF